MVISERIGGLNLYQRFKKKLYTLSYYFSNFTMHFWDMMRGTDFSFIDKSVERDGRSPYYATPWASLFHLSRYIKRNLSDGMGHSILDIGCGKGFMLYYFSRKSFSKVSGIEYEKHLKAIAGKNLRKLCREKESIPSVYKGDAVYFRNYHEYDVFYLYNPFDRITLERVITRIMASMKDHPRTLYLFYCNPLYEDLLPDYGWRETAHFYYKTKVYIHEGKEPYC